jgi:hypothetical protein
MGQVLLAAAAYLLVLAMLSRGPLGLVRILGPRVHQAFDLALVAGLAVSPIIVRGDLDIAGVIVAEALAIVLLRVALRTHYAPALASSTSDAGADPDAVAHPSVQEPAAPSPPSAPSTGPEEGNDDTEQAEATPPAARRPAPTTAWTAGVLAARARRRGTGPDRTLGEGARRLGTALGRANRRRSG